MVQGVDVKVKDPPLNPVSATPKVGSVVIARRQLKAWENDYERGRNGLIVDQGDAGLVLQVWREGRQIRIRMLIKGAIVLFSHADHCVWLNWAHGEG